MKIINSMNSKAKKIIKTQPKWALAIYFKLPDSIKSLVYNKYSQNTGTRKVDRLKKTNLFPLDSAWSEAIFAPFHDPEISPTLPVEFQSINAHGCELSYTWCWTVLKWEGCPSNKDAASLSLICDIETTTYDSLIFCLTIPKETALRFEIKLDGAWQSHESEFRGTGKRMEVILPINGSMLNALKLVFKTYSSSIQRICLSWFGLRNSHLNRKMHEHAKQYHTNWSGLVKPPEEWEAVKFEIGLLFDESDIPRLQRKKNLPGWDDNFRLLEEKAREYFQRCPEKDFGEYLPLDDTRYIREFETGKTRYYFEALVLGFVGLINDDRKMMFHALRYLMCMIHTRHWAQSAESRLPGSTWDQRCFLEEMTTTSVSLLFDWFGFALTERAKDLIRQSIWDKGLAVIERDLMKYEYLYHINQGAVFCRARILGGLHFEKSWPRSGKYVKRAFSDMSTCLNNYVEKDGGMHEGIGYFCQTLQATLPAIIAYAKSRGEKPGKYIRRFFANCDQYVAAMSGSKPGMAIPEGDCRIDYFCGDAIPVLAGVFPDKIYKHILKACISAGTIFSVTGTLTGSGGIVGFLYGPDNIPESVCIAPEFAVLGKTGHLASFRKNKDHSFRFHLTGSKPNPSHSHLDKGNIIVEISGTPMLIERGMVEYYYSECYELKSSYTHNVITPLLSDGTYPDQTMPKKPIISKGQGNSQTLSAEIDLSNVWQHYMTFCSRKIESPAPHLYRIIDAGELKEQGRIAFHLHSLFPFNTESEKIVLTNGNITLSIKADWAEDVLHRQYSLNLKHEPVYHLTIHSKSLRNFNLVTAIEVLSQ